jgi:hypothetical protein
MAGKIPFGATVARAYSFAFGNIVNNLGMIWIPVVILWVANYFLQKPYLEATMGAAGNPQALFAAMPLMFLYFAISFVLVAAQVAALTKEALGLRTGSAFLQFPFGAGTWRLLAAFFLYFIVMIVVYVAVLFGSLLLAGLTVAFSGGHGGAAARVMGFIVFGAVVFAVCALIYIATRLSFFLAPVAVAEHKVSLIRAWQLSARNFWRIFAVFLILFLPFFVLELIFFYMFFGPKFFMPPHPGMTPQEIMAHAQHQQEIVRQMTQKMQSYWFVVYPVGVAVALILYGLYAGAVAYAYRAVTHQDNSQEVF